MCFNQYLSCANTKEEVEVNNSEGIFATDNSSDSSTSETVRSCNAIKDLYTMLVLCEQEELLLRILVHGASLLYCKI